MGHTHTDTPILIDFGQIEIGPYLGVIVKKFDRLLALEAKK
jgi:hypothetical protein